MSIKGYDVEDKLVHAASNGHLAIVQGYLDEGISPNAQEYWNHTSALQGAIVNSHTDIANLLLSYKADVNLSNKFGYTALKTAINLGDTDKVEKLLFHGADTHQTDMHGRDAYYYANDNTSPAMSLEGHGRRIQIEEFSREDILSLITNYDNIKSDNPIALDKLTQAYHEGFQTTDFLTNYKGEAEKISVELVTLYNALQEDDAYTATEMVYVQDINPEDLGDLNTYNYGYLDYFKSHAFADEGDYYM